MTYTLKIWRKQAAEKLTQVSNWLDRRHEDVPYVVYGMLCGLLLCQLVKRLRPRVKAAELCQLRWSSPSGVWLRCLSRSGYYPYHCA